MIKYIYYILIAFILVFVQQTILTAFDTLIDLNLLLVFLVFITIIFGFNLGFVFAIFIGLFISLFSFLPFGSFIVIYLLVVMVVNFLYKNVFINLSFYTGVILIIVASILYSLLVLVFSYIFYLISLSNVYIVLDQTFLISFWWQILLNAIFMAFIFLVAKITIKRLNLAFLLKK